MVGTTKQDDLGRVFAGDDTVEVLSDAPVAVAPAGWSAPTTTLQRVGVGYDESAGSERALAVARTLASERGARHGGTSGGTERRSARSRRNSSAAVGMKSR